MLGGHTKTHQVGHTLNSKPNHSFRWPVVMRRDGDWSRHIFCELQWTWWRFKKNCSICKAYGKNKWTPIIGRKPQHAGNDWGNEQMYLSHGASNSKGVAIIITNNYDANMVNKRRDTNGRLILLNIQRNGTIYKDWNIYAPMRNFEHDQWLFLREFTNYLEQMQTMKT